MDKEEKYLKLLKKVLEVGLNHNTYISYSSTFCEHNCEGCKLEDKIELILKKHEVWALE